MFQKVLFGPLDKAENGAVRDLHGREIWVFGIIVVAALVLGIFPQPFLSRSEPSVNAFITGYRDRLQDARKAPEAPPHVYPALPAAAPAAARRRRPPRRPPARRPPRPRPSRPEAWPSDLRRHPALRLHADADPDRHGLLILLAETFVRGPSRAGLAWLGVAGCVAALAAVVMQWPDAAEAKSHFDAMLVADRMALYLDGAFIVAAAADAAVLAPATSASTAARSASTTRWCCSRRRAW